MTAPALQRGDFVWCAFPEREFPLRPGPLHVGYGLAVTAAGDRFGVLTAYTSSRPWPGKLPFGVIAFDSDAAASCGQARAFILDVRRMAYLPLNGEWFCRLHDAGRGILGRASKSVRDRIDVTATELAVRRPERVNRGPLW